jgi:hypothetical protein
MKTLPRATRRSHWPSTDGGYGRTPPPVFCVAQSDGSREGLSIRTELRLRPSGGGVSKPEGRNIGRARSR